MIRGIVALAILLGTLHAAHALAAGTGAGPPAEHEPAASEDTRININTAGPAELVQLPGIGPTRAQALWLVLLALPLASPAAAHTRSMSYSTWRLDDDGASIELRLKLLHAFTECPAPLRFYLVPSRIDSPTRRILWTSSPA